MVVAAPSHPTRKAFRIMLRTRLRVSEALSLRCSHLRLNQDPPAIGVRPEVPGNKARKGPEVPVPADLLESLADLASFHAKDRDCPMLEMSRQWVGEAMKRATVEAKIDSGRSHTHAFRHAYGRNCVLRGVPLPVMQQWLGHQSLADTQRYVELSGAHHS